MKKYSEPLTSMMDNLHAYELGRIVNQSYILSKEHASDNIDAGLGLRRLLEERGFYLIRRES